MTTQFSSKQPYEAYAISFDFTAYLGVETIASAVITAVDQATGVDVSTIVLNVAEQSISSPHVYTQVRAGESGHSYTITCRIVGSLGSQYELDGVLPVQEIPSADGSVTFKMQLAADLTEVFFNSDEFAEEAVYTPYGGVAKAVDLILSQEDPAIQTPAPPGDTMVVLAKFADIALPGRGDTFLINAETWFFVENVGGGRAEGIWHIRVSRSARRVVGG